MFSKCHKFPIYFLYFPICCWSCHTILLNIFSFSNIDLLHLSVMDCDKPELIRLIEALVTLMCIPAFLCNCFECTKY